MTMPAGAGGTIPSTAEKLKGKIPGVQIVAVDPYGDTLAEPNSLNDGSKRTGQVEDIGYGVSPAGLGRQVADHWVETDDDEAFATMRSIVRHEGLPTDGGYGSTVPAPTASSGSVTSAGTSAWRCASLTRPGIAGAR